MFNQIDHEIDEIVEFEGSTHSFLHPSYLTLLHKMPISPCTDVHLGVRLFLVLFLGGNSTNSSSALQLTAPKLKRPHLQPSFCIQHEAFANGPLDLPTVSKAATNKNECFCQQESETFSRHGSKSTSWAPQIFAMFSGKPSNVGNPILTQAK